MSHDLDIWSSCSSILEFSMLKTPIRLPSSCNLRINIICCITKEHQNQKSKHKTMRIVENNILCKTSFYITTHKFSWYFFQLSNHLEPLHVNNHLEPSHIFSLKYWITCISSMAMYYIASVLNFHPTLHWKQVEK